MMKARFLFTFMLSASLVWPVAAQEAAPAEPVTPDSESEPADTVPRDAAPEPGASDEAVATPAQPGPEAQAEQEIDAETGATKALDPEAVTTEATSGTAEELEAATPAPFPPAGEVEAKTVEPLPDPAPPPEARHFSEPRIYGDDARAYAPGNQCLLDDLCVGPVVTLGVINPIGFGLHARYGKYIGFGIDYQLLPRITVNDVLSRFTDFEADTSVSAHWSMLTVDARVYPFGGAFWIGGGFGYQRVLASARGNMEETGEISASGAVGLPGFKFGLGFMGRSGLVIGIDIGVLVPIGSRDFGVTTHAGNFDDATVAEQARLRDVVEDAGRQIIDWLPLVPQVNLFRIGYLF